MYIKALQRNASTPLLSFNVMPKKIEQFSTMCENIGYHECKGEVIYAEP